MRYTFADCTLDTRCYALHRAGVRVPLGPKAFRVLAYLLQHRDRVVVKAELSALLWPGQAISDTALTRCLASLRKALGDTGRAQQILQTVYGYGYRVIATVHEGPAGPAPGTDPAGGPQEGFPLQAQPTPASAAPGPWPEEVSTPTDVRRDVTVLCGALVQTARLEPPRLQDLVAHFVAQAHGAVQHWGGTLHTVLDDSFVALFGVPTPCEDHAQRAVQAARQLQRALDGPETASGAADGAPVALRLGAHTGGMLGRRLGTDRRWTYLALGDTLRHALRLQQLAEPDTLLLSEVTARRVHGDVGLAVGSPISLRLSVPPAP